MTDFNTIFPLFICQVWQLNTCCVCPSKSYVSLQDSYFCYFTEPKIAIYYSIHFFNVYISRWCWQMLGFCLIFNRHCLIWNNDAIITLCTAHIFVSISFLQHFQNVCNHIAQSEIKFHTNMLCFKNLHFLYIRKSTCMKHSLI